jgi:hypothetical protein
MRRRLPWQLLRYHPDGRIDTGFGAGGTMTVSSIAGLRFEECRRATSGYAQQGSAAHSRGARPSRLERAIAGECLPMLMDILIAIVIVAIAAVLGIVVHPVLWIIVIAAVLWLFVRRGRGNNKA